MEIYMNKVEWTIRGHSFSCKACHRVFFTNITGLQLMNYNFQNERKEG